MQIAAAKAAAIARARHGGIFISGKGREFSRFIMLVGIGNVLDPD
jgi:hypothetical protein